MVKKQLGQLSEEEENFMKTTGLQALWTCMTKITGKTGVWRENYINLSIEICEIYNNKGFICICDGDNKTVHYGWKE